MQYDPIKDRLGRIFGVHPALKKLFFSLLHVVFLRSWYVRREVRALLGAEAFDRTVDVLDAGSGFGQYTYFVARKYPSARVLAVDVKQDYLDSARQFIQQTALRDRIEFAAHDLTALELHRSFDLILSVDVMEHIDDDEAVFHNFERLLRDGGHVVINTPSDLGGSDVSGGRNEGFIEEHVRPGYGMDELTSKLRKSGLDPVRAFYTYGRYGSWAWRLLVKWPMLMLARTRAALAVLPAYYMIALPLGSLLNLADMHTENARGTGLLVVAGKAASKAAGFETSTIRRG